MHFGYHMCDTTEFRVYQISSRYEIRATKKI